MGKITCIGFRYSILISLFLFLLSSQYMQAQVSNERIKVLYPQNDTIQIDSLSIIPQSEFILFFKNGEIVSPVIYPYQIKYAESQFIFTSKTYPDSVKITYKVFPYLFTQQYFHKDPGKLIEGDINLRPYTYQTNAPQPYLNMKGLDYNGSLVRGISFGNNQDVVVNSSFNLQMSGKLQNDVQVSAAISDNNIPIQPEGNTQQLQEFDKVFIKLSKDGQALTMGDFELYKPASYFLNFYKKSQGALYEGTYKNAGNGSLKTKASLAVSKGIYTKQTVSILEGNQGPYKLRGINGEVFIIILAGTERVYIDGKLLVRGAENDYVIDYNASEITFTVNQLLTKDKRVTVEYEYSDKNYFRSLVYLNNEYTTNNTKLKLKFNVYSEQDSKNQPLDQTLDSLGRSILKSVGDSVNHAFAPGYDTLTFTAQRIMYKLIDTLGFDSVFVYSTSPDSAQYVLIFTELGTNKGNYIQTATLANGVVYKWVAPAGGIPQGTAEPVILLIAPKKNQMLTFGEDYAFNKNNFLSSEIAYSNADVNTFSQIDNADNDGIAVHTNYQNTIQFDSLKLLRSTFQYEFAGKNFIPVERYRPVEFNRDWNIISTEKTNEHFATADFNFIPAKYISVNAGSSTFIRENFYSGFRQSVNANYITGKWVLNAAGSYLISNADTIDTRFFRPNIQLTKIFPKLKNWSTGIRYEAEHNKIYERADSLLASSYYYNQYQFTIKNADTAINKYAFNVIVRNDKLPKSGINTNVTQGITYSASGNLNKNTNNTFSWQASYRTLAIIDTSLTVLKPDNALLGRIQHNLIVKKGLLTSDIFYELSTGQEPKREYTYVQVEPGQGVYTWLDYNGNGIPELNEFEIATFTDQANYIQVFIPTNEYIQSDVTQFNYAIGLNPKVIWFNKKGLENFIGKFSSQSSLQLNKKVIDDKTFNAYNPFFKTIDSLLVSSDILWQNTIYFNRLSTISGIDYTFQKIFNKQVIINGPESRNKAEHKIVARYKLLDPLTLNVTFIKGNKNLISEAFADKNYLIPYYSIEPKLNFIKETKYRITTSYQYNKSNNNEGIEKLTGNEFSLEMRYNVVSKSTISTKISYININYTGIQDSPVGFAMLEGLQNGNNILWNVNLDKKLSQVLQLTISYEGRKTGDANITHVGRLQMRAVF